MAGKVLEFKPKYSMNLVIAILREREIENPNPFISRYILTSSGKWFQVFMGSVEERNTPPTFYASIKR